jgi:hypothetical protein
LRAACHDNFESMKVELPATSEAARISISSKSSKHTLAYLFGIVAFWALIYIPGLSSPPMMDDADSEHARIAG